VRRKVARKVRRQPILVDPELAAPRPSGWVALDVSNYGCLKLRKLELLPVDRLDLDRPAVHQVERSNLDLLYFHCNHCDSCFPRTGYAAASDSNIGNDICTNG